MRHYIAVHEHSEGITLALFSAAIDACAVFNALPQDDKDTENPDWELTQVDFARGLNLNFEPHREEFLTVYEVEPVFNPVDLSLYPTQTQGVKYDPIKTEG